MKEYNINELRSGFKIIFDNEPCIVINNEFIKPGKGQAFNRVRLRKLISDKILDRTFKSCDMVPGADVISINLVYLYHDMEFLYFINKKTYEQISVNKQSIGNNIKWIVEQAEYTLTLWNNIPIIVTPPNFLDMKVIEVSPYIKRGTVVTGNKLAKLSTGVVIKVPSFIQIGEVIKVNTKTEEYISRVK